MVKVTEKIHYLFDGKWQDVRDIYSQIKHQTNSRDSIIGSAVVQIREDKDSPENDLTDARIVFVKDRHSDKWLALLCTDLGVSEEEVVRIYGKRWDIEVFFKVCKSYLALAKEYQGRSYDMQVSATSIVFLRYVMLSMETRNATDERTIGDLFYYMREELADIKISQSLMLLIDTLRQVLNNLPVLSQELAEKIMNEFLFAVPDPFKHHLLFCA